MKNMNETVMEAISLEQMFRMLEEMDSMVNTPGMPQALRLEYRRRIEEIRGRIQDQNLYLALIGEVNAGKSTLINRLMGMKLLKTAHKPATSLPTRIRTKRFLAEPVLRVTTASGIITDLHSSQSIRVFAAVHGRTLPEQLDECIAAITTGEEWTKIVREAEILVPQTMLDEHIVILDTPGINAVGEENAQHAERTQQILCHEADAVLLLVKGGAAMLSRTMTDFFRENAPNVMNNAMIMVNCMDQVDEEEREDVLRFVRRTAKHAFDTQADVPVMSCSALCVGRDAQWTQAFEDAKAQICDYLQKARLKMVRRHIAEVMSMLIEDMMRITRIRVDAIAEQKQAHQNNSMQDMEEMRKNAESDMEKRLSEITKRVFEQLNRAQLEGSEACIGTIAGMLEKKKSRSSILEFAKDTKQLMKLAEPMLRNMWVQTQTAMDRFADECQYISRKYTKELERGYSEIKESSYDGHDVLKLSLEHIIEFAPVLSDDLPMVRLNRRINNTAMVCGMILGGAMFCSMGVISVVMGALACGGGMVLLADLLYMKKTRKETFVKIGDSIAAYNCDNAKELYKAFCKWAEQTMKETAAFCQAQQSAYGAAYERVYHQMESDKKSLEAQEEQATGMIRRLEEMRACLES